MQDNDKIPEQLYEAVRIAVRRAYAEVRTEERKAEKKKTLYNTRYLMENYVELKNHIVNAISEENEIPDNQQLEYKGKNVSLNSIRDSRMKTAMMILNIDRAMKELEKESRKEGVLYKYEAFRLHYIDGLSYEEIADKLKCGKNSPANWSKTILRKMSVKLFGINGI